MPKRKTPAQPTLTPDPAAKRAYEPNKKLLELPAQCPRCGSVKRKVLQTTKRPHTPLKIGDQTWPGRIIRRCICDKCACRFIVSSPLDEETSA